MTRMLSILALLIPLTAASGCLVQPKFEVSYEVPELKGPASSRASVLVTPFKDARPSLREDKSYKDFLLLLPGWLTVDTVYRRVDEIVLRNSRRGGFMYGGAPPSYMFVKGGGNFGGAPLWEIVLDNGKPPTWPVKTLPDPMMKHFTCALPKALSQDLKRSKVAHRVSFYQDHAEPQRFDYVLEGTLLDSEYRVTSSSYGLGPLGMIFWYGFVPRELVSARVKVALQLRDTKSNEVVWKRTVEGEQESYRTVAGTSSMHYGDGWAAFAFHIREGCDDHSANSKSVFWWHSMALCKAMKIVRPELRAFLMLEQARQDSPQRWMTWTQKNSTPSKSG